MTHRQRPSRGFTLVELIVAMAVAALLMYMINRIFFDTTRAIGRGMALSDNIQSNRAVSFTLEKDAEAMIGPNVNGGGVLVIFQHQPFAPVPVVDATIKGTATRNVRSDQLMFIRSLSSSSPLKPLVPRDNTSYTYGNDTAVDTATHARVWYGHIQRTASDGSDLGNGQIGDPTDLGNPNLVATNWILGRQMLFLTNAAPSGTHAFYSVDGTLNENTTNDYFRIPAPQAAITNSFTLPTFANSNRLYMGLCDVAWIGARDPATTSGSSDYNTGSAPAVRFGLDSLTGNYTGAAGEAQPFLATSPAPFAGGPYRQRGYMLTFGNTRLRVNPDFQAGGLESWRVAQMHGYLVPRVSDFIVEFAGDYVGSDGLIDTTAASSGNDVNGVPYTIDAGMIKWYTHEAYANNPTDGAPVVYDSTLPLTYKAVVEGVSDPDTDPGLRPRNDTLVSSVSIYDDAPGLSEATAAFVFRHDDAGANSRWPKLLRIRYRMHDLRGELRSGNGQHGIWFEQIIRVTPP
jgi:prepilin-type N-terminal cleavage/methylation domain-containing protein